MAKETKKKLTEVMNQLDSTDIYTAFYPKTKEYSFCSAPHGTFSKTHHILGHKAGLKRQIQGDCNNPNKNDETSCLILIIKLGMEMYVVATT